MTTINTYQELLDCMIKFKRLPNKRVSILALAIIFPKKQLKSYDLRKNDANIMFPLTVDKKGNRGVITSQSLVKPHKKKCLTLQEEKISNIHSRECTIKIFKHTLKLV